MAYSTDFLVIGTGISGLSFALKAAKIGRVTIVTKKAKVDTATNLAQGGIAAVLSDEDSFDLHIQDTLRSGAGLCKEEVVRMVVENGPARVQELLDIGVHFKTREQNSFHLDLGREGGHSARRIAHALDLTGREIENALLHKVAENANIHLLENHLAVDLLIGSKAAVPRADSSFDDLCLGAYVLDRTSGDIDNWQAKVTVLCSGGCGKVYLYTTNPDIATGDGIAMAYRAGANVGNLEFVQFHPTCLYHPKIKNFLISEAVRGDTVARAIDTEMKASGDDCVYLDISDKDADYIKNRFPTIYQTCFSLGIDMTREPIPVVPAAHYMCGGVMTDMWGRTNVENLYALGETACTGLHGANRLASNSLLEAVVFAHQTYLQCEREKEKIIQTPFHEAPEWSTGTAKMINEKVLVSHNWDQIRRLMWNYVGIVRNENRLELVKKRLAPILQEIAHHFRDYLLTPDLVELRNISLVAELIVQSSLIRKESRGLHSIVDYPRQDDVNWRHDTILSRRDKTLKSYLLDPNEYE
jgi:L-aspartate oxidase